MIKTNRTDYDLIISLGGNCSVAQQVRHRGMRICSLPLDWLFMPDEKPLKMLCRLLVSRFDGFCRYENMVLLDPPFEEYGEFRCKLMDTYSGYRIPHHFTAPFSDRANYDRKLAVLKRRIERMYGLASKAKHLLFGLSTVFKFAPELLTDVHNALSAAFPQAEIEIVNLQFGAETCEEFDFMDGKVHIARYEREWDDVYDTQLTAPEWRWLDRLSLTGRPSPDCLRRRNLKLKWMFKLWFALGKYLERHNVACANMRFNRWD